MGGMTLAPRGGACRVRARQGAALLLMAVAVAACAPQHTVKPLPNFVTTALAPGDKVRIVTRDGVTATLVLSAVSPAALEGDGRRIELGDIATLKKIAWERPDSPCGGQRPLGCSVPWFIHLASERHSHYADVFYDACTEHDYCYRHGARTYGAERVECDDRFLADMLTLCPEKSDGVLTKALELLDDSVESRRVCVAVAQDYHGAVQHYGGEGFRSDTSTYCEYDGPVSLP
ncbi:MAG: hypothetical protein AAFX10_02305 [Pseudomonadota bacterium]